MNDLGLSGLSLSKDLDSGLAFCPQGGRQARNAHNPTREAGVPMPLATAQLGCHRDDMGCGAGAGS